MHDLPEKTRIRQRIDLPGQVLVPNKLTDEQIIGTSYTRVNGRFPILTYFNSQLNIAIWRSSEPDQ